MRSRYRRGLLDGIAREHAREMRRGPTAAEKLLWAELRRKNIGGARFRRQHPLFGFIPDFCCVECRIIIELDGDSHADSVEYDAWRTGKLARRGFRVLRFRNDEVKDDLEGVMKRIGKAIRRQRQTPPPASSPVSKNGGGK